MEGLFFTVSSIIGVFQQQQKIISKMFIYFCQTPKLKH